MAAIPWYETEKNKHYTRMAIILAVLIFLAGVALLASLIVSDKLSPINYAAPETRASLDQNLRIASLFFGLGLWLFIFALLARKPLEESLGWAFLIIGTIAYLFAPYLLIRLVPNIELQELGSPGWNLLATLQKNSAGLFCIGGVRIAIGLILSGFVKKKNLALAHYDKENLYKILCRICPEVTTCKISDKKKCPKIKEQTVACWKSGRDCRSDLINFGWHPTIVPDKSQEEEFEEEAGVKIYHLGKDANYNKDDKKDNEEEESHKTPRQCMRCYVFLEHQRDKERIASWIIYPFVSIITLIFAGYIRRAWYDLDVFLASALTNLSILRIPERYGTSDYTASLDTSIVMVIIVGIMIVSIFNKVTEYMLYKLGW